MRISGCLDSPGLGAARAAAKASNIGKHLVSMRLPPQLRTAISPQRLPEGVIQIDEIGARVVSLVVVQLRTPPGCRLWPVWMGLDAAAAFGHDARIAGGPRVHETGI